ncbi:hypothetical protein [Nostoc sp.]|uniref:hypothetical protein n=1 Tax=Nostoc sp. TaxID=1180 RepID=UPI002FF1530A
MSLVIGHWSLVISHWSLVISLILPCPSAPLPPAPLPPAPTLSDAISSCSN